MTVIRWACRFVSTRVTSFMVAIGVVLRNSTACILTLVTTHPLTGALPMVFRCLTPVRVGVIKGGGVFQQHQITACIDFTMRGLPKFCATISLKSTQWNRKKLTRLIRIYLLLNEKLICRFKIDKFR